MKCNAQRFVLGSVVSALVLFVASGIVNGVILCSDWKAWQSSLETLNHAPSQSVGMILWTIVSLIYGIAGMWIYIGARSHSGAGPKTAAKAGFILWLAGSLTAALGHFALNDIPERIAIVNCIAYLIVDPLALLAGAALYKDRT